MTAVPVTAPERITVGLVAKAARDLASLQERTGLSKTDVVNRAISLYEFIDAEQAAGREIAVRDADGTVQVVRFL